MTARMLGLVLLLATLALPAEALAAADVSLTMTADPASVRLGASTTVDMIASNAGPDPATAVVATTTIGAGLTFSGFVTITQGSGTQNGSTITANFGTIAAGGAATLRWTLTGAQSGQSTLPGSVTTSAPDANAGNDAFTLTIPVTAIDVAPAAAFGATELGRIGPPIAVTVTNRANAPLALGAAQRSGAAAGDYLVADDACSGKTIAVDAACTIVLRLAPSAEGSRDATLTVPSETAGASPATVALSGTATAAAQGVPGPQGSPGPQGIPGPQGVPGTAAVRLLVVPFQTRLAVAAGRRVRVRYVSTRSGSATLVVRRAGRSIARLRRAARAGRNAIAWSGRRRGAPAPAGRYSLLLTVRTADQTARTRVNLRLRRPRQRGASRR